jgi:hypothetical protein
MSSHFLRAITLIGALAGGVAGNVIYTNGNPNYADGLEINTYIQASDFTLANSATFNSIRFWAAQGNFAGSIYWAVLDSVNGAPGTNTIAFGLVSSVASTPTGNSVAGFDVFQYNFATGNVALQAGTYWLVLHNGDLSVDTPNDFFWLTAAANGSLAGHEAIVSGGSYGTFVSNGVEHAFELHSTANEVSEPGTWLLSAGALAALLAWKKPRFVASLTASLASVCFGASDPLLRPGTPTFDRSTLTTIGVVLPISGDDNFDSRINVRFRRVGTTAWKDAQPLYRVRPETVAGVILQPHYAGSIFHLRPGTSYDVELQAIDPDGGNQTFNLTNSTRTVPADPPAPRRISVNNAAALQTALNASAAGDIITVADGTYTGNFDVPRAGAAGNPIVIRGTSQAGTILDGAGCTGCNVFNVYGAGYVHIDNLTIRNAERAIRFQTTGATGNVVRRVVTTNVSAAIAARDGQRDFYIADNRFLGPISWPATYGSDGGAQAGFSGVALAGEGHVIAHNFFSGWSDSIWQWSPNARALDVYGNDFKDQYDNSIELDFSSGNVRFFRNRITNAFMPISLQPIRGGPAYIFRNVATNVVSEAVKFHAQGVEEPSGVLVYQNTFVTADVPLQVQTGAASHWFTIRGNLFVGPPVTTGGAAVQWTGSINNGVFNDNGYYPDGVFAYNFAGVGYRQYGSLAAARAATGVEAQGFLATPGVFANGLVGVSNYTIAQNPVDLTLAATSPALDRSLLLSNVNDSFRGASPDAGALERGCPEPLYGPRPLGTDESNGVYGCESAEASGTAAWLQNNTTARGTWTNIFGSRGWIIAGEGSSASSPVSLGPIGVNPTIWANPSSSFRALRKTPPSLFRIASGWTGVSQLTIEINAKASAPVQLAAYFLDWQTAPRSQTVEFLDALTGAVLAPPQTYSAFQNGVWGVWRISGRVRMRITEATPGQGVTLSGIFFD